MHKPRLMATGGAEMKFCIPERPCHMAKQTAPEGEVKKKAGGISKF